MQCGECYDSECKGLEEASWIGGQLCKLSLSLSGNCSSLLQEMLGIS